MEHSTSQPDSPRETAVHEAASFFLAFARGIALLLGMFTLWNVIGEWRHPGFDANLWWIDLRFTQVSARHAAMIATGFVLVVFGVRPQYAPLRGWGTTTWLLLLIVVALFNSISFRQLLSSGQIRSSFPLPLSAVIALVLFFIVCGVQMRHCRRIGVSRDRIVCLCSMIVGACLFPLAQMYCFGCTDYRRKADLVVVFGCLVHEDGSPSQALADRVRTGVELYQSGLADHLLFSGGPGPNGTHETLAMQRLAIDLGVPASAITLDVKGVNTQATVRNLIRTEGRTSSKRVLAVSHFYHLPRIKLSFRRAGWDVFTVPATETRRLIGMPRMLIREIAALWWYYIDLDPPD